MFSNAPFSPQFFDATRSRHAGLMTDIDICDKSIDKLIALMRGDIDDLDPDFWCQVVHLEQNGFDISLLKDHILHYAMKANDGPFFDGIHDGSANAHRLGAEYTQQILLRLRERARTDLGLPHLTGQQKANWQYTAANLDRYQQPWAGSDAKHAPLTDKESDTLAERIADVFRARYPLIVDYYNAVQDHNDKIWPPPHIGRRPRNFIFADNVLGAYVSHILTQMLGQKGPLFSFQNVLDKLREL